MSYILKQKGFHDEAIARAWVNHFMYATHVVKDEEVRRKILKVMSSCVNEEQLANYFFVVKKYTEALSFVEEPTLKNLMMYYLVKLRQWL